MIVKFFVDTYPIRSVWCGVTTLPYLIISTRIELRNQGYVNAKNIKKINIFATHYINAKLEVRINKMACSVYSSSLTLQKGRKTLCYEIGNISECS